MRRIILFLLLFAVPVMAKPVYIANELQYGTNTIGAIQLIDASGYFASFDSSGAFFMLGEYERCIDEGKAFYVDGLNLSLADGAGMTFIWETSSKKCHTKWSVSGEYEIQLYLYECPTNAGTGTTISPMNNDFSSTNVTTVTAYLATNITANGTLKYSAIFGSGKKTGGSADVDYHIISKQNTKYLFILTNNSGNASWVDYQWVWCEEAE